MSRHRFYADPESIKNKTIVLSAEESHHLSRVLRLNAGDEAFAFDGLGNEYRCLVRNSNKSSAALEVIERLADAVESPLALTLAQAIGKGEKFDLVVQKATELGVQRIAPLLTDRTDVRINTAEIEKSSRKVERWERISLESVKQCGRRRLVNIDAPVRLDDFLADDLHGQEASLVLAFATEHDTGTSGLKQTASQYSPGRNVVALVGPEGGWSEREERLMVERDCAFVSLGPRVLRTETAGIVAVALIQQLLGDLS